MGLAYCKLTLIFNGPSQGWTENYYSVASTQSVALSQGQQLSAARRIILAADSSIVALRATIYPSPNTTQLYGQPDSVTGPGTYGPNGLPENVRCLFSIRGGGISNRVYLGGIPTTALIQDQFPPFSAWFLLAQIFGVTLQTTTFGYLAVGQVKQGVGSSVGVSSISPRTPRGFTAVHAPATLTLGQRARFTATQSVYQGINGIKICVGGAGVGSTASAWGGATPVGPSGAPPALASIAFVPETLQSSPIQYARPVRRVRKDAGRFFGAEVGRQRNRIPLRR